MHSSKIETADLTQNVKFYTPAFLFNLEQSQISLVGHTLESPGTMCTRIANHKLG